MNLGSTGLGTRLRTVLTLLDNDVESLYSRLGTGFRPRFYPIVMHLLRDETANVGQLAVAAGVTQPAVTQTLGEMEKLGLIHVTVAADRRVRTITLSREGRAMAERLAPAWSAVDLAAQQLDRELPFPLSALLDATIAALRDQSFINRIETNLQGD